MNQKPVESRAESPYVSLREAVDPQDVMPLREPRAANPGVAWLTARELQIAAQVCCGKLNKQIAAQLNISEHTVNTHLRRMYCKLGVNNRAGLVGRCLPLLQFGQS